MFASFISKNKINNINNIIILLWLYYSYSATHIVCTLTEDRCIFVLDAANFILFAFYVFNVFFYFGIMEV